MPSVVLLLPKSGYRNDDFLAAAQRLGLEVILATDVCHRLAESWDEAPLALRFRDAEAAADELARAVAARKPLAVVGVDDLTALVAALAAERLALPAQSAGSGRRGPKKADQPREAARGAAFRCPRFEVVPRDLEGEEREALLARAPYPCVVKPLILSGSRGVIRADDRERLRAALARVAALLRSPDVAQRRDPDLERVMIEEFVPGPEVALEGLLIRGHLHVLALVRQAGPAGRALTSRRRSTSRLPALRPAVQDAVAREVSRGCAALGPARRSRPRRVAPLARWAADPGDRRAQHRRALRARAALRGRASRSRT